MSTHPSLSKSFASDPMPDTLSPCMLYATPDSSPRSLNVPFPWFMKRKLGSVSFATKMSIHPSRSKSAMEMPIPLPRALPIPLASVTSSNLPVPRLRYSRDATLLYTVGVQYSSCSGSRRHLLIALRSPQRVVGHDQIEPAIVVIVEPRRANAQQVFRLCDPALNPPSHR